MITRRQAIEAIFDDVVDSDLVLCATGMISREVFEVQDRPSNFYMIGSMGLLSSFGLGLALMSPGQRVIVLLELLAVGDELLPVQHREHEVT